MARISEKDLILPALFVIKNNENKEITTSELIKKLEELIELDEADKGIIQGRQDSYFSQKVRNLKSHNTLQKKGFAIYQDGKFKITKEGEEYLNQHEEELKNIVIEEKFLQQYSQIIETYYDEFKNSIDNIKKLVETYSVDSSLQAHFFNMLYSSIITSLETYLSDALKFHLSKNKEYLIKFVETFKDFENIKCSFNDIFNLYDTIENKVEDGLRSFLYHNLPKVQSIYKSTFNIDFLAIQELMKSISIRHDLIHRNGKKADGTYHNIGKNDILELCKNTLIFVQHIEEQFEQLNDE